MSSSTPTFVGAREGTAVLALGLVFLIAAGWWALALWPTDAGSAEWLVRTREVCFGAPRGGLPDGTGWALMIGQPLGLLVMLHLIWGEALRGGIASMARSLGGKVALGAGVTLLVLGLGASAARVASALEVERGYGSLLERSASSLNDVLSVDDWPRLDLEAPPLGLVDQFGEIVDLDRYAGRPVLVTFAFGHCATICPIVVKRALTARAGVPELDPALIVITLDPWRDLPTRLPTIAESWELTGEGAHVLSGEVDAVEGVLDGWNIARERDLRTGDIVHPALVYIVDGEGRIAFATNGDPEKVIELLRRL